MDRGGARLGGVIELGLSKYVFCDHFGFVYALALEECDRVVAARLVMRFNPVPVVAIVTS